MLDGRFRQKGAKKKRGNPHRNSYPESRVSRKKVFRVISSFVIDELCA